MTVKNSIMIVEDEGVTAMVIQKSLEAMGYAITSVETTAEEAVNKAPIDKPDLVLMDITLAGEMDGIEAAERIYSGFNVPVVYISAHSDEKIMQRIKETEPFGYIIKPFDERDLRIAVEIALFKHGMERKLRESENKFHSLFNNATDGIFLFSHAKDDLIIEDLNDAACAMHGYTRQELIGKPISLLDDQETGDHIPERSKALMSGKTLFLEARHVRKDSSTFPVEISARLIRIEGKPYILASDRDITKRKEIEAELRERMQLAELGADIGIALTRGQTIRESLQLCSDALVKHLDVLFARIWTFDEHADILQLQASSGLYTHIDGGHSRVQMGKYKIGLIAQNRKPHYTNKVQGDPLVHDQEWVKREGIVSFAGHPLIVEGSLVGVMAMFSLNPLTDITLKALSYVANDIGIGIKQKLLGEKIIRAKEEWEKTFDTIPDIVILIDNQYRIIRANKAMAEKLGVAKEELVGKLCYKLFHNADEPPFHCPHNKTITSGKEHLEEFHAKNLDAHYIVSSSPLFDPEGRVFGIVEIAHDISDRKRMEEQLKATAITDELTGLLNRRGFFTLAEQQCKLSDRTGRRISLLYIDLDGLKTINDELGHDAGDQALIDAANVLRKTFREADIIARIGGDEFVVLLSDPSSPGIEDVVSGHVKNNLVVQNEQGGRDYALIFSMGIANYDPERPCSVGELLTRADELMYDDKERHRRENPLRPL